MPMLQAILLSAGDFARGALHAKIFPEPIRMQLLDFYSHGTPCAKNRLFSIVIKIKTVKNITRQPSSKTVKTARFFKMLTLS